MKTETQVLKIIIIWKASSWAPWPLTWTIKLNSPPGFFDCLFFWDALRLFPLHHFHARFEKLDQYVFVFDVLSKRRRDSALNRRDLYTGGHRALIMFPNIEWPDGKYFIRRRVDKWPASIVSVAVDSLWTRTMRLWILTDCLWASDGRWIGFAAHHRLGTSELLLIIMSAVIDRRLWLCSRLHCSNSLLYVLKSLGGRGCRPTDWTVGAVWLETHKGFFLKMTPT